MVALYNEFDDGMMVHGLVIALLVEQFTTHYRPIQYWVISMIRQPIVSIESCHH